MRRAGLVVCDLDGVVWLAGDPLPGVADGIARLRDAGADLLFLTNNSSRPVREYVGVLAGIGVEAAPDEVLTSAVVAADVLAGALDPGGRVLACAGDGVVEALEGVGLSVVDAWPCEAVVVGWHREFDYDRMERASTAVRNGARFVATNLDPTYPAPEGLVPGNGALVAAVTAAAGIKPEVVGKPFAPTVDAVLGRANGCTGVVVGDRPSTDGALAAALGWPFVLVHSDASASEVGAQIEVAMEGDRLADLVDHVVALIGRET